MDAQSRGRADEIDPADQWVLNPRTGNYELRLGNPAAQTRRASVASPRRASPSAPAPTAPSPSVPGPRRGDGPPGGRRSGRSRKGGGGGGRRKKALAVTGGTLAFLLVGGAVGAYLYYDHLNGNLSVTDVAGAGTGGFKKDQAINILVIGTDKRDGKGNEGYGDPGSVGHADTTLLFHVSEDRTNATALSIPRDMIMDIPDCPTKKDGKTTIIPGTKGARFNESLGQEGRDPGCTWRTTEALTGLKVTHFMMADFNAVKELSSAVGGVEVCLAKDINDPKSHLKLSKGRHEIEGEDALAFVRTRHSVGFESDLDRIKLQQQFLSSMIRKMKSGDTLSNPKKLYDLGNAATKSLTVDTGIGSGSKLTSLGKELSKVDLENITFATVPVKDNPAEGKNHRTVVLDPPKAEPLFAMVRQDVSLTEVKEKEKKAKDAADAKQAALLKGPKAEPAAVRVKVQNGSGRVGAAQEAVTWMQNSKGMRLTSNGGNATGGKKDKTILEFAPNQADQARRLAEVMGLPVEALKQATSDAAPTAGMTLVLGADFKAAGTPISIPAPAKAPKDIQKIEADDKNICAK